MGETDWRKLGLVLMGRAMLSKSLIQFSVDGWSCVPSLLFTWGPTMVGFPGGSDGKASVYNVGDPDSIAGWEDPLEKEMATHSSVLAWRIQGWGSLVGCHLWGRIEKQLSSGSSNRML